MASRRFQDAVNLVTLANRGLDLAESNLGRAVLAEHALDVSLAIPNELLPNHPSLGNWIQRSLEPRKGRMEALAQAEGLRLGTPWEVVFSGGGGEEALPFGPPP